MELVRTAAAQVLNGLPDEMESITSRKLKELVMPLLPDGGVNVSDKVFKAGLLRLNEESAELLVQGVPGWVKPSPTARSWLRAGTLPAPAQP
ncbi:MAG: hypothetical protein FJ077_12720 [Cyanobacteria bacterium K_DeepCast_35m_m2_023]|nr:hypothetical protein [Cyanobacteria bacterium K_DeepCast_35m_m2_023]